MEAIGHFFFGFVVGVAFVMALLVTRLARDVGTMYEALTTYARLVKAHLKYSEACIARLNAVRFQGLTTPFILPGQEN